MIAEIDQDCHSSAWRQAKNVERACIVLMQSELDIAFGFLRLADAEISGGNGAHADELISKAGKSYKSTLNALAMVSQEFEEERQLLLEGIRALKDAIRTVAFHRQHVLNEQQQLHQLG